MALILVLTSITVLTVMLSEFQDQTAAELGSALAERDAVQAEYAARSAVNLSRLLLASEPTVRKALGPLFLAMGGPRQIPIWQFADQILGAFNDQAGGAAFGALAGVDMNQAKGMGLGGARYELQIVDEDSKINLNVVARASAFYQERLSSQLMSLMGPPQYDPLFEQRGPDGNFHDRATICGALVDWADPDVEGYSCAMGTQVTASTAPEDSYYQLLKTPYSRKNAAFDSLEEVHRVRGISEAFWNTFFDPDPEDPSKRVVTVWGQETININSAGAQTLLAIACNPKYGDPTHPVCTDPNQASQFLMLYSMLKGATMGAPLFGSPRGFILSLQGKGQFGAMVKSFLPPMNLLSPQMLTKMLSTESKVFSIYATGMVKNGQRETRTKIHAVVDFRNAPPPGMNRSLTEPGSAGAAMMEQNAAAQSATSTTGTEDVDPLDALQKAMRPGAGGTVLYYRIN